MQVTWAQPGYFEPFFPLFLLYSLYEMVVRRMKARKLASYIFVRATRANGSRADAATTPVPVHIRG